MMLKDWIRDAAEIIHARADDYRPYGTLPGARIEEIIRESCSSTDDALILAIRAHRDARGDDRCWRDDEALYKILPEGYVPPARDTSVELEACRRYIASRENPATVYVSPQRRIEELEALLCGTPRTEVLLRLRTTFDNFLVAEVKRHDGIPALTPEDLALREAVAELLSDEPHEPSFEVQQRYLNDAVFHNVVHRFIVSDRDLLFSLADFEVALRFARWVLAERARRPGRNFPLDPA